MKHESTLAEAPVRVLRRHADAPAQYADCTPVPLQTLCSNSRSRPMDSPSMRLGPTCLAKRMKYL